ncbi:MAG: Wadjet anti-phage system protein JetD domain-containing protein [Trinickia sp.]|uniref:Wadjet anti-phage system protein JetD domain-containing protein n=1 Tax=Trinickia sp. TaxID=2571163 RepID=UPI003F806995
MRAFPDVPQSTVLFGAGYGWEVLEPARWLTGCALHYWGDIDTHGFAILDQLRSRFPHVGSFLMDRATLMAHEAFWGDEDDQVIRDLPRLTTQESELFDDLRDNRIRHGLRLEQERIGFGWVRAALEQRMAATTHD